MSQGASPLSDPQSAQLLRVCRIGRAQGLKGEVNVMSFTDAPRTRFAPDTTLVTEAGETFTVERSRNYKSRWIIKFSGVDDRTAAEALNGTTLYTTPPDPTDAESGDEDDDGYYFTDLIGLTARLEGGTTVGRVTDVTEMPGQDLLEITEPHGSVSLVPFVEQIVTDVDLDAGTLTLDPPGGLLTELPPTE